MTVAEARKVRPTFGDPLALEAIALLRLADELSMLQEAALESAADEGLGLSFEPMGEADEAELRRRIAGLRPVPGLS